MKNRKTVVFRTKSLYVF